MLSSDRRLFCLGLSAALAGCGFRPVYGPGGTAAGLQDSVLVEAPVDRDAYLLTREIEDRLGRGGSAARFGLSYSVDVRSESVAISSDNVTTRYNLLGEVKFALRDRTSTKVVTSGKARNFTGYSASGSTVATQAAQTDARARLMVILAGQIIRQLEAASVLIETP